MILGLRKCDFSLKKFKCFKTFCAIFILFVPLIVAFNPDKLVSFSILMHAIAYNIDDSEKRAEITKELKQLIPDLYFGNGIKQKINTFLFYKAEHLYINLRVKQKKIIKPISKLVFLIFQGKK